MTDPMGDSFVALWKKLAEHERESSGEFKELAVTVGAMLSLIARLEAAERKRDELRAERDLARAACADLRAELGATKRNLNRLRPEKTS